MRLFLASESPRRRELLKNLIADFEVESAEVCELGADCALSPEAIVAHNAAIKAEAVALKHPDAWVLGADTVVAMDGRVYGKPRNMAEAKEFLRSFSGRSHSVLTAVALRCGAAGEKVDFISCSQVVFQKLSEDVIAEYLRLVPVLDKAGAYAIQEYGDMLVESVTGELENVIGLPVAALREQLVNIGII